MTELEIEINNDIDNLTIRLNEIKEIRDCQRKLDNLDNIRVGMKVITDHWNYKLEKLRDNV